MEYKVTSKEIISPWEWDKLDPVEGKNILTLLTCDPLLPPRPKRLLVNAELLEEEEESDLIKDDTKVSSNVKRLNNSILFVTGVLIISLCISLIKFAIYLRKSK